MSYEVPSDEKRDRQFRIEAQVTRAQNRSISTPSINADQSAIGAGSKDYATGVMLGNFVMNPESHIESIEISWTGASGTLNNGDIVDTTATAWQGKFLFLVSGNSAAGTGVFEPQNSTVFTDVAQTLNVSTTWTGATYTTSSVKTGRIVIISTSVIIDTADASAPTLTKIYGAKNDGQFTTVKPKEGKTLTITTGGNIDISANVTVEDSGLSILQFQEDNVTPDTAGSWNIVTGGGSGSSSAKLPVRVATTVNGVLATAYENGDTVDGVVLVTGDRILLKNQSTAAENGIYTVNATGAPTRATDFATGLTSVAGLLIPVEEGSTNDNSVWIVTTNNPTTVGTTGLAFSDITGGVSTNEFADNVFRIFDNSDNTKKIAFEVSGITTATTRTFTMPDSTTTLAGLGVPSQSWTGTNIFVGIINVRTSNFKIQNTADITKQLDFSLAGATTGKTMTIVSNHSDDRIITLPDITGTLFTSPAAVQLDMNSNSITNASFVESNTANRSGSGFIRMATTDEIRMRNAGNTDDVIITSGNDALGNDSVIFNIAGANQFTMSNLNLDLLQNNLKGVGNITPSSTGFDVGDGGTPFLRMFADFFIPDPAAVILGRYALAKTGNTIYINFDNVNADAGFSIYEEGFESFRFYHPTSTVNEFHIGSSTVFTAGEEYAIQLGEGSEAARIFLIEGSGNDLILDRIGGGATDGVQVRVAGGSAQRWLSTETKFFTTLNINTQDLQNVVNIKSNGAGGATTGVIGELITSDGGFNYFMRDTLAWESDAAKKLTMGSSGITLETNGTNDDIDIKAQGTGSSIDMFVNATGTLTVGIFATTTITITNSAITFQGDPIVLTNGTEEIRFNDAIANASVTTPLTGFITLFNDLTTGNLSVKKFGGAVIDLETVGGGDMILASTQTNTGLKTFLNTTFGLRNQANTQTGLFTHASTVSPVWTMPTTSQNIVGSSQTITLTNKTIDGDLNTIIDINETQQNVSVGASGTVLTSNGVGSPPTYQSGGVGDAVLANAQTFTAINTFSNGTLNGIVMTGGTKLEFENASVSNLEIHAESNLRDPADLSDATRSGLEIDMNTGAVPDTEVFQIGDGATAPWMLMDDTTVRFNTALSGSTGHEMFLSKNALSVNGEAVSTIFAQTKIDALNYLKFAQIKMVSLEVSATAANNVGRMRLGAVSNNILNTGITIDGAGAGITGTKLAFYGTSTVAQQVLAASPTAAQISTVLEALGLTKFT